MGNWAEDPELLATFRAEVEDRLASLSAGLLQLENHPSPKQLVASLFRDAHTVKGSARMMGLQGVLDTAHAAEDLLGAIRDGRFQARRDLVDLLLATVDGISRSIPGVAAPIPGEHLAALIEALRGAIAGDDPVSVPRLAEPVPVAASAVVFPAPPPKQESESQPTTAVIVPPPPTPPSPAATSLPPMSPLPPMSTMSTMPAAPNVVLPLGVDRGERALDSVRVTSQRVYDLLDVVGEAELDTRRVEKNAAEVIALVADQNRWLRTFREALAANAAQLPEEAELAMHRVVSVGEQLHASGQQLRELVEDSRGRLGVVRDGAMGLAMVPVRRVVAAFPRLVRDVASSTGKDVGLNLVGEDVELDKKVLDGVADALKHLLINAVDHGCEKPEERIAAGKPPRAVVTVSAKSSDLPSMENAMSPVASRLKPVAVTMMSASSVLPDFKRMPVSVKRSISSVTTDALPAAMPLNRSPSGMKAMRCRHGR